MADKNHEQYLEQIETAVAETTQKLLQEDALLTRRMAGMLAEKQVEIDRLKEFKKDDRKTIRDLRGHLKELAEEGVAEVTELKKENEFLKKGFANLDEVKQDEVEFITAKWDKCKEYVAKLEEELEEWKAIHPEWTPSGDLTPNFISECLDDQYENIKELKEEKEALEEEVDELRSDLDQATEVNDKLKMEKNPVVITITDTCMEEECKGLREEGMTLLQENEKLKAEMNRVFQAVYSYDGDYDGKIDELVYKAKKQYKEIEKLKKLHRSLKQKEISTQIAIRLEAATSRLDEEGWEWNEEKQDYVED